MKRIGFALVAGLATVLFAGSPVSADDVVTAPAPKVVTPPAVVGGPVITGDVVTTGSTRRGLFSRIRARRTANTVTDTMPLPTSGTVTAPVVPAPGSSVAPVPTQMPVRPVPGTVSMAVPVNGVIPVAGTVVTSGAPVVTVAGGPTMTTTVVTPVRRGLFGRFRY